MKNFLKHFGFAMVVGSIMCSGNIATATTSFSIDEVDGDWINATPAAAISILNSGASGGLSIARWGISTGFGSSGYDFLSASTPVTAFSDGTAFSLGTFTHLNLPITGTPLTSIDLSLSLEDLGIFNLSSTFSFSHNETPNNTGTSPADNDIVTITNPVLNTLFTYGGQNYYFNLFGFSQNGGTTLSNVFSTIEGQANIATLYARITEAPVNTVPEPATMLLFGTGLAGLAAVRRRGKA